ncbi:histidine phosphatase family protein [Peribacillus sp. SCS-26]|uniref:histidine phosphatase family protein n=1 Tax=Paraperibacillus marinus TaxID=3115295 RepID=UPI003905FD69
MKVGLLRHFKVIRGYPKRMVSSDELMRWVEEYDASEVEENEIEGCGVEWQKCFSSTLPRAEKTAEKAYAGEIIFLDELREIQLSPLFSSRFRLPLPLHLLFIRIAWLLNHKSQPISRKEVLQSIESVLDRILSEKGDVLIVGHGGVMMFMRKSLIKRGFTGPKFRTPDNGKIYIYENH